MTSPPPSPSHSPITTPLRAPNKRQKREEYRTTATKNAASCSKHPPPALPKKKFYRQRAHANPFSDHQLAYPAHPSQMDWAPYFPAYIAAAGSEEEGDDAKKENSLSSNLNPRPNHWPRPAPLPLTKPITVADVGCGFGGLLVELAPLLPDDLILGLEIRTQASQYATDRIHALRAQHAPTPTPNSPPKPPPQTPYQNTSCIRSNAMKFLPNLFPPHSLTRLFLCFPDPHFKARKHKARIISSTLVAEYAHVLRPGTGWLYFVTDVEDLFRWARDCFEGGEAGRRLFVEVGEGEREGDVGTKMMRGGTEEGRKVVRNGGEMFVGVWRRREVEPWPGEGEGGREGERG